MAFRVVFSQEFFPDLKEHLKESLSVVLSQLRFFHALDGAGLVGALLLLLLFQRTQLKQCGDAPPTVLRHLDSSTLAVGVRQMCANHEPLGFSFEPRAHPSRPRDVPVTLPFAS